jgi:polyisoprenoid-binding protein YceI
MRHISATRREAGFLFVLAMSLGSSTVASGATYGIVPGDPNEVTFVSKAPLETFDGSTKHISGSVELDPQALGDSITVEVSVDLATLDTGIDLRNQHMRENHLHTDEHPSAVFRGAHLVGEHANSLTPGAPAMLTLAGSFSLHGVTRRVELPVTLTLDAETGELEVSSEFVVYLADYEIPRPKMLFVKLDEKQTVTFRAVAVPKG